MVSYTKISVKMKKLLEAGGEEAVEEFNALKAKQKAKNPNYHVDASGVFVDSGSSYVSLPGIDLSGDKISGSVFKPQSPLDYKPVVNSLPKGMNLDNIIAENCNMNRAYARNSSMRYGKYNGSMMAHMNIRDCDCEGSDFRSSKKRQTDLGFIEVNDSKTITVNTSGTNLKFVLLDRKSLNSASDSFKILWQRQNNEATYELLRNGDIEKFEKYMKECEVFKPDYREYNLGGLDLSGLSDDSLNRMTVSMKTNLKRVKINQKLIDKLDKSEESFYSHWSESNLHSSREIEKSNEKINNGKFSFFDRS